VYFSVIRHQTALLFRLELSQFLQFASFTGSNMATKMYYNDDTAQLGIRTFLLEYIGTRQSLLYVIQDNHHM